MIPSCFQIYFNPVFIYVKRVFIMASENDYSILKLSFSLSAIMQTTLSIYKMDIFGVSNFLLLMVILTVLIDAVFGVLKSKKQSDENYDLAMTYSDDSIEIKKLLKLFELKKFNPAKLQFTFFKCFTLLGYLFFIKHMIQMQDSESVINEVIGLASSVVLKAPVAIFWYYDFKSIGENSEYYYGKKAPIFVIVEKIFEPKLNDFLNNKKE